MIAFALQLEFQRVLQVLYKAERYAAEKHSVLMAISSFPHTAHAGYIGRKYGMV